MKYNTVIYTEMLFTFLYTMHPPSMDTITETDSMATYNQDSMATIDNGIFVPQILFLLAHTAMTY